ncbi:hypothetical protein KKB55_19590 [Myxococcota bacterium]|nr:hypothetical protein [Myxococcota bacterium]MBU1899951.1 hypothetical protein [Myxococcota bacterium]
MSHAPRFIAWGELLWDLLPSGPRLGGASANAAYHAGIAGADVTLISRIGADTWGASAIEGCAALGLDVQHLQVDPARPTGKVRILAVVEDEPVYDIEGGVAWEHIALEAEAEAALRAAEIFCFGTLAQRVQTAGCEAALAALGPECVRLCDLNLRPGTPSHLIDWALSHADALKINEVEYEILRARLGVNDLAPALFERTPIRRLAVTRGAAGCEIWAAGGSHERVEAPPAAAGGDPIGAGDAFTAVFSVGLAQGLALRAAAARANRYASIIASEASATPPPSQAARAALRHA